jgi:hypothetical protein
VSADTQRKREKREAEKAKKSDEIMRAKLAYDKKNVDKAIAAQVRLDFHLFSFKYTAKICTFLHYLYMS